VRLERASTYALLALGNLACHGHERPLRVQQISHETGVPAEYLRKLMRRLTEAGVVHSVRGPGGGIALVKAAKDVTILQVVEAIEGLIAPEALVDDDLLGPRHGHGLHGLERWRRRTAEDFRAILGGTTLADLLR
jgi:Rrf2 family transcriptional regulator, iron-sulfur cluster assembly transcription factor